MKLDSDGDDVPEGLKDEFILRMRELSSVEVINKTMTLAAMRCLEILEEAVGEDGSGDPELIVRILASWFGRHLVAGTKLQEALEEDVIQ